MTPDVNPPDRARAAAVLLHPHPGFGGNRFHPFIDGLFRRLPETDVAAIRFDFTSADPAVARGEASAALDVAAERWPEVPLAIVGYSFGAAVATGISDERVAGWYLLAPPSDRLATAVIGADPRPKAVVLPEDDQYFAPDASQKDVAGWESTSVTVVPAADHFLGAAGPFVDAAVEWIRRLADA
ncbi:MAG TPA: hypothetical protein VLX59_19190 [Acidimicrobiales bacterium]|nr:hypothetical protein [Acidimicrobiales bacterium]